MLPIVLATANPHKVDELRAIFAAAGIDVIGLNDLPPECIPAGGLREPEETGRTFEENATIKALSYAKQTGRVCLADDSGIEIDALALADGTPRPGVISSHYCTDGRETGMSRAERDAANNARVLRELERVREGLRAAQFVCVMVLAGPTASGGAGVPPAVALPGRHWPVAPPSVLADPWASVSTNLRGTSRQLPHWQAGGSTYFITFNTHAGELSDAERQIVLDACFFWHERKLMTEVVVVMPDHVHMLLTPLPVGDHRWHLLSDILHSIKSFTAHEISKRRGISGPVWQDESFDRIVRTPHEYREKWRYIVKNPVKAGLVARASHYPFLRTRGQHEIAARAHPRGPAANADGRRDACPTGCKVLATSRGAFEGRIGIPPRVPAGSNGFGYDPLFLVAPEFVRTGAELASEEKNRMSHRAKAAVEMVGQLKG